MTETKKYIAVVENRGFDIGAVVDYNPNDVAHLLVKKGSKKASLELFDEKKHKGLVDNLADILKSRKAENERIIAKVEARTGVKMVRTKK